jgi:hypothetical protein
LKSQLSSKRLQRVNIDQEDTILWNYSVKSELMVVRHETDLRQPLSFNTHSSSLHYWTVSFSFVLSYVFSNLATLLLIFIWIESVCLVYFDNSKSIVVIGLLHLWETLKLSLSSLLQEIGSNLRSSQFFWRDVLHKITRKRRRNHSKENCSWLFRVNWNKISSQEEEWSGGIFFSTTVCYKLCNLSVQSHGMRSLSKILFLHPNCKP